MAIKPELVKAGDVLWQKKRVKMGNTNISRDAVYEVGIISVEERPRENGLPPLRTFEVSWNGNRAQRWTGKQVSGLYRNKPAVKPSPFDRW